MTEIQVLGTDTWLTRLVKACENIRRQGAAGDPRYIHTLLHAAKVVERDWTKLIEWVEDQAFAAWLDEVLATPAGRELFCTVRQVQTHTPSMGWLLDQLERTADYHEIDVDAAYGEPAPAHLHEGYELQKAQALQTAQQGFQDAIDAGMSLSDLTRLIALWQRMRPGTTVTIAAGDTPGVVLLHVRC
jgi:hypothetical protein